VRSSKDLPHPPTRTALGHIPHDADLSRTSNYLVHSPHTPLAEAYRRLRTNLQFLDASRPLRTFVVTSTLPGEGKSTTAVNLALVMAEKGSHVLLVDADLRSPSIADLCGLEGAAGLSAVLIHEAAIEDVAQPWQVAGLDVIAAGQVPPNPSQLVESHAMEEFIGRALELYDLVILDTPPLLAVTDGAVLARRTDGALVVARSRAVKQPDLAESLASLDAVGSHVLGVLVNDVRDNRADRHYGYGTSKPARGHESVRHLRRRPVARVAHVEQGTSLWPAEMPRHSASSAVPARGDAPDGADEQIDHDGPRSVQETGLRTTED
jgi:capsular exopolysaccharide synthesis family protein